MFDMGLQMQSRVLTVLAVLAVGVAGGYMVVTPVDAAQLFNSSKSKPQESAQNKDAPKTSDKGAVTLFNKPHDGVKAMQNPYTSKSQKSTSRMTYRFPEGIEGFRVKSAFVKDQMQRVSTSHIKVRGMAENRQLGYVDRSVRARMNDRTMYALQLEKERREYTYRRTEAENKLAALEMRQAQEDHARNREEILRNQQEWEKFKNERRQSKYGRQVDRALGSVPSYGSTTGDGAVVRRSAGDGNSSKPRPVFNPID